MNIIKFEIEESKVNKGMKILVATAEDHERYVVGGDTGYPTSLVPYDKCWDAIGQDKFTDLSKGK